MLEPDPRALYTNLLRPPPGFSFDRAVATTYSLDLLTLLTVPLSLVLTGSGSGDEALRDPIALLESVRRTSQRLRVYCQRGQIAVPGAGLRDRRG